MRGLKDCTFGISLFHEVKKTFIPFIWHIAIIANLTKFILFARHFAKHFKCVASFNPQNIPMREIL